MKRYKFLALMVILIWFMTGTGCLPHDSGMETSVNTTDRPGITDIPVNEKEAAILTAAPFVSDPNPLKPSSELGVAFYQLTYKNMVQIDEKQQCIPSIAREWKMSEDLKTWRFVISDDIFFHDGSLLTAQDVIFTLETIKSYGDSSPYYTHVINIKTMEVAGNELVITLYSEDITFPWKMNIPVVSKKTFHLTDNVSCLNGTGPFKAVSMDDTGITLKKIDNDRLSFKLQYVSSAKETKGILKPGNNAMAVVPADEGDLYEKRVDLFKNTYAGNEFTFIAFNCNASNTNKPNIRKAVSCFLDVEELVKQVYGDYAVRADYPVHPDSFLQEWAIGFIQEYDIEKGKELMKQEGVPLYGGFYQKVQPITTVDAEGNTVTTYRYVPLRFRILVNAYDERKMDLAQQIKSQLEANGIQATINAQSGDKVKELISKKDYDILVSSVSLTNIPDPYIIGMLYRPGEGYRLPNVCNLTAKNDLTALCEKAMQASSLSDMMEGLNDVQMYLKNGVPYIGLCYEKISCVYSRTITGSFGSDVFSFFRNPEELDCR